MSAGLPQNSIPGPLLYKCFFLFISNSSLSNYYADDNKFCTFRDNLEKIKKNLSIYFKTVKPSFYENYEVANARKFHFGCFGKKQ